MFTRGYSPTILNNPNVWDHNSSIGPILNQDQGLDWALFYMLEKELLFSMSQNPSLFIQCELS
jgi:hypothetical protein